MRFLHQFFRSTDLKYSRGTNWKNFSLSVSLSSGILFFLTFANLRLSTNLKMHMIVTKVTVVASHLLRMKPESLKRELKKNLGSCGGKHLVKSKKETRKREKVKEKNLYHLLQRNQGILLSA